ncbi:Aste57867_25483 [Aphanomyces stellatus]|uniref:Aste57867_25483 protein n=1 Tax=Aphanomyces stellatus TaxID=120398 RepID=A0A485LY17_9STRA|nr:hypothetical protein As57867_025404 [Aphanomyces stellatus]VFU02106.1 Aste57867_25483 [Aphanomyces stellatus]
MNSFSMQRILDREADRIEAALEKNFEYLERLDRARADAVAKAQARLHAPAEGGGGSGSGKKKTDKNSGVYVTGLTTYMACKQLESLCHRLGRVKRVKFYKDDRGSLKGDALVVFATFAMMEAAIAKLHNCEIKPGVRITATPAEYSAKKEAIDTDAPTTTSPPVDEAQVLVDSFLQEMQQELGVQMTDAVPPPPPPVDVASQAAPPPSTMPSEHTLDQPSRSVVLRGILDAETTSDDFLDVKEDLHGECSKYGTVVQVSIRAETQDVAVEFAALDAAIECLKVMNGRWFGGQQIHASFDPSKPEVPEDPDLMLQAFLASV